MPIDYSKWDKIELSDDSDVEVHPNVDKPSFIRWKQRDIHEKRQQRNIEIKSILVQLTMYAKLNYRVDYLLKYLNASELLDEATVVNVLNKKFDPAEKFDYEKLKQEKGDDLRKGLRDLTFDPEESANTPPYNEMIEDLFTQVKEDHPEAATDGEKLIGHIREHRQKIDDVLLKNTIKLDDLLYQKSMLISSDDIHPGFDRSFLNKDEEEAPAPKPAKKETVTTIETLNTPSEKTVDEQFDELDLLPATAEFAKLPMKDLEASAQFLIKHTSICTENQKDSLIMTAFNHELDGNHLTVRQVVFQSLLLQYVSQLAGPKPTRDLTIRAISLFFSKLKDPSQPASKAFMQDVDNTVNHIKTRCQILKKEQEENDDGEEALIQLKALDESTELFVNTPEQGTGDYEVFRTKLSPEMQKAIESGSLDEVNLVFAKMKVEEAEAILEIFNECNIIGVSGVLENEDEFQKLKEQYEGHQIEQGEDAEDEEQERVYVDEVD